MEEFLPLFGQNKLAGIPVRGNKTDFFFQFDFDDKGAFVSPVDSKKNILFPDYRLYSGHEMTALRLIDEIRQKQAQTITWDNTNTERIYLEAHHYLLYELLACTNLEDAKGQKIEVSPEKISLQLRLTEKENDTITSSIYAIEKERASADFRFLSDSFVLAGNHVYPINPVGGNYQMLPVFKTEFEKGLLERFLSVFCSYLNNIDIAYHDYEVVHSDTEITTTPTISFEKVDTDQALYLQLQQLVPGLDLNFFRRFELLYIASLTSDHKIVLKRIAYKSDESETKELYDTIIKYAPKKSERKNVFQDKGLFIIPAEVAAPFLLQALPDLLRKYHLVGAEKLKEYKVSTVQPKLDVKLGSGIDFLDGEAEINLGDEKFSLSSFLKQYNKQKYITLSDGNRVIIDSGYVNRLERLFRKSKRKDTYKVSFFDLPEVEDLLQQQLTGEAFVRHRRVYEGFNNLSSEKITLKNIRAQLRPYQVEGVKWIDYLYKNNLGGCLADDMGLGKTLQTIAMLTLIYPKAKKPALVVMPRSLLFNWQNELARFAPQLDSYTYYGNTRDMDEAYRHQVILTTYALVRNDIGQFSKKDFEMVILDESQNIKNVTAQTTQAIYLLSTRHRLALSGTPVENNLTELYSLFRFLNPSMFGTLEDFNTSYTYPIQKNDDKEVMYSLRKKIYPFMLRRLKKNVLKDLPDRIEQTLYVDMNAPQAAFYEQRRRYFYQQVKTTIKKEGIGKSQFVMFQALNELRRIASIPESMSDGQVVSPKLETLMDTLCDAVSNGHKIVVFFNYIAGIELVGNLLDERGIDYVSMTGSTHDRRALVERFQNDPKCKVFLMTLKTGGVGLNLVAADIVFIFEPWWNKAAEEQAVNRLHRIGQKSKVLSYSIITRQTIEEKILQLQKQKAELFEGLIGNDASSVKQLTEEDIQFILG